MGAQVTKITGIILRPGEVLSLAPVPQPDGFFMAHAIDMGDGSLSIDAEAPAGATLRIDPADHKDAIRAWQSRAAKARFAAMTPADRRALAKKAAQKRWKKHNEKKALDIASRLA